MRTKNKEMRDEKIIALSKFLGCEYEDCPTIGEEYLVYDDDEANEAATEYIKDSVWAFNVDFIIGECGLDLSGAKSLRHMQENSCESANDFILSLIEKTCGIEDFVDSAISADGRGHFLNPYDGEENEVEVNGTTYYIYRIN